MSGENGKNGSARSRGNWQIWFALTEDYFSVPEEEIKVIESVLTVVGGKSCTGVGISQHAPPALPVLPEWSPVKVVRRLRRAIGRPQKPLGPVCRSRASTRRSAASRLRGSGASAVCRREGRLESLRRFLRSGLRLFRFLTECGVMAEKFLEMAFTDSCSARTALLWKFASHPCYGGAR